MCSGAATFQKAYEVALSAYAAVQEEEAARRALMAKRPPPSSSASAKSFKSRSSLLQARGTLLLLVQRSVSSVRKIGTLVKTVMVLLSSAFIAKVKVIVHTLALRTLVQTR